MSLALPRARAPLTGNLTSGGLSNLGNAMSGVIYPWIVFDLTGSATAMGVVAFATLTPLVIGALLCGFVIDRLGVRPTALAANAMSAATAITVALLHGFGLLSFPVLVVLASLGAVLDGPGAIAHDLRWPNLARMARMPLVRANVLDDIVKNGCQLGAPVLAGLVLAFGGGAAGLQLLAAISAGALVTTFVMLPRSPLRFRTSPSTLRENLAGAGFVIQTPALLTPLALCALGTSVFVAIESVALPAMLRAEGASASDLGTFLACSALGALLINVALLALPSTPPPRFVFTSAFVGLSVALGLLAIDHSVFALGMAGTALGLAAGPLTPLVQTLLQTVPPRAIRARVLGSSFGLILVAAPVSALAAGVTIEMLGSADLLAAMACITICGAIGSFIALAPPKPAAGNDPAPEINPDRPPSASPLRSSGHVSLARLSLIYDWKRYLAAVLAVAFSGLLLIVQLGLLLGMFSTVTVVLERAKADLWVVAGGTQSFDLARAIPARVEMRLRSHPGVQTVQTLDAGVADWRRPDGGTVLVYLTGFNVGPASLSFPRNLTVQQRRALEPLGAVVVDEIDLQKLGVGIGDTVEINRRRVTVVGTMTGMRAIGGANVFASQATVRWLQGEAAPQGSPYYLVKLAAGSDHDRVRDELQQEAGALGYRVMNADEFGIQSQLYWLLESGSGAGFGFATILGLLVGVAITSQTLRAAVLSALREYATLRALGVSLSALRAVVIEQSLWIGMAGLGVTAVLTALVAVAAHSTGIAIQLPWWSLLSAALFTLFVALFSGWLSLKPLYATEPAELLR